MTKQRAKGAKLMRGISVAHWRRLIHQPAAPATTVIGKYGFDKGDVRDQRGSLAWGGAWTVAQTPQACYNESVNSDWILWGLHSLPGHES